MNHFLKTVLFLHTRKLYLIPIVACLLFFIVSVLQRTVVIFPGLARGSIEAFDDHTGNGDSRIICTDTAADGVTFEYTLGEKIQYPYSGIKLLLKNDGRYRNLSGYDYFNVRLTTKSEQEINIFLHTILPGYTDDSKALSYRYLLKTIKCSRPDQDFHVPLTVFSVPTWWYVLNKFPDDSLKPETFKQVAEIIIENGFDNKTSTPYMVTVHEVSFGKSIARRGLTTAGVAVGWLLLYTLLYLFAKNLQQKKSGGNDRKIVVSYEPLEVSSDSDDSLNRIVAYIAREYKNADLALNQVASEVGVSPFKITQLLKEKKNCGYKQYLNSIRLTEAKRLLMETDRNIVDIAQKVGYNNVTHFNRIFKEIEGVSPRQYRTSIKKTDENEI
jgi:AraC-like DNA-binding protein